MRKQQLLLGTTCLALMTVVPNSVAQTVEDGARKLDTVTVTATKRETTLAETTVTVSVIDGANIANEGIDEVTELFGTVPGIAFHQSPGDLPVPKIRGIGSDSANQTFEQSVGLFLDGVYKPRARQYRDALFDVERVEVIRGAQGVVFGKNTSVGAVSITSRKPGDDFGGEVAASYETEFESYSVTGSVDLPASEIVKFRLAAQYSDTGGYVENTTLNRTDGDTERWVARGTMSVDPVDAWDATLMIQHSVLETIGNNFEFVELFDGPLAPLLLSEDFEHAVDGDLAFPDGFVFPDQGDEQTSSDVSLELNFDYSDNLMFTSLTSYSEFEFTNIFDVFTFAPSPVLPLSGSQQFDESFEQFTQEFRFDYQSEKFALLGGIFFQDQEFTFANQTGLANFILPAGDFAGFQLSGAGTGTLTSDSTTASVFGQASIDLTDKLSLDFGLRASQEEKDATYSYTNDSLLGLAPISIPADFFLDPSIPGPRNLISIAPLLSPDGTAFTDLDDDAIDAAITLSYAINDAWLTHVSLSQGTKSGGFNNANAEGQVEPDPFTVEPEVAQTAELGLKGTFADGRGYLSAALFYSEIQDFQASVFDPNAGIAGGFVTRNLDATSQGLEMETQFAASDAITLSGSLGLLDATNDETGGELAVAPEFTLGAGFDYDDQFNSSLSLQFGASINHSSGFLHRQTPIGGLMIPQNDPIETGEYALVDAYIGLTLLESGVQLRLDADNLTDEKYSTFGYVQPVLEGGIVGAFNRPRTLELSIRVPF
ncbi:MAG: TonB-dependent receptor [Pseudomonadota bacterium]